MRSSCSQGARIPQGTLLAGILELPSVVNAEASMSGVVGSLLLPAAVELTARWAAEAVKRLQTLHKSEQLLLGNQKVLGSKIQYFQAKCRLTKFRLHKNPIPSLSAAAEGQPGGVSGEQVLA